MNLLEKKTPKPSKSRNALVCHFWDPSKSPTAPALPRCSPSPRWTRRPRLPSLQSDHGRFVCFVCLFVCLFLFVCFFDFFFNKQKLQKEEESKKTKGLTWIDWCRLSKNLRGTWNLLKKHHTQRHLPTSHTETFAYIGMKENQQIFCVVQSQKEKSKTVAIHTFQNLLNLYFSFKTMCSSFQYKERNPRRVLWLPQKSCSICNEYVCMSPQECKCMRTHSKATRDSPTIW